MFIDGGMNYKNPQKPSILYFIDGMVPTPDEKTEAATYPGTVSFRNVRFIDPSHNLEPCDFVAGVIPPSYAHIPLARATQAMAESAAVELPLPPKPALRPPPVKRGADKPPTVDSTGWGKQ